MSRLRRRASWPPKYRPSSVLARPLIRPAETAAAETVGTTLSISARERATDMIWRSIGALILRVLKNQCCQYQRWADRVSSNRRIFCILFALGHAQLPIRRCGTLSRRNFLYKLV